MTQDTGNSPNYVGSVARAVQEQFILWALKRLPDIFDKQLDLGFDLSTEDSRFFGSLGIDQGLLD